MLSSQYNVRTDQCIIPAIWCAAAEAAEFYAETFREGSVVEWAPGPAATVSIHGFRLSLIDGSNQYTPNPSISCILSSDPLLFGGEKQAEPTLMSSTSGSALAAPS